MRHICTVCVTDRELCSRGVSMLRKMRSGRAPLRQGDGDDRRAETVKG